MKSAHEKLTVYAPIHNNKHEIKWRFDEKEPTTPESYKFSIDPYLESRQTDEILRMCQSSLKTNNIVSQLTFNHEKFNTIQNFQNNQRLIRFLYIEKKSTHIRHPMRHTRQSISRIFYISLWNKNDRFVRYENKI